jgi:Ulp1 family protease
MHYFRSTHGDYEDYKYSPSWYEHVTDLFSKQFLIYPTNHQNWHWFLVVVYIPERRIISYDSSNLSHDDYLDIIEKSLLDEATHRQLEDIVDLATGAFKIPFTKEKYKDMPRQRNNYDCGVFMLMLINFLIDSIPIHLLSQKDMASYRITLAADIIHQKMNYYYEIKN